MVGVGLLVVLAAEWWLLMLSIAPFFGDYPTATESRVIALAMITLVLLETVLAWIAWRAARRWLVLIFVVPGTAALAQTVALLLNTTPDTETTLPSWDVVTLVGGFNLSLTLVVVVLGVVLTTRRRRQESAHGSVA